MAIPTLHRIPRIRGTVRATSWRAGALRRPIPTFYRAPDAIAMAWIVASVSLSVCLSVSFATLRGSYQNQRVGRDNPRQTTGKNLSRGQLGVKRSKDVLGLTT